MGSLTIIQGPMFSSKSTRLIQELTRFVDVTSEHLETKCILINHSFDDRNKEIGVSSHNSSFKGVSKLIEIKQSDDLTTVDVSEYDVIGIDEGQFFQNIDPIYQWVNSGKIVIIAGLIGDAFMKPFGKLTELMPFADNIIQCHAICTECIKRKDILITPDVLSGMKAPFTFRLVKSDEQVAVGASESYIPVCRFHYNVLKNL